MSDAEFNPNEESKAVVANSDKGQGCVLWWKGEHIRCEIDEAGLYALDDLGLDDAPHGISIWEGTYVWEPGGFEYPMDGESHPVGTFRKPTDDEWEAIREGRSPWDDE